jgi:sugar phosphate isomerase/epimerase
VSSFGTTEFFANANANVGWQIDVANFFVSQRVPAQPEEARAFVDQHAGKLVYAHIKSATKDNKTAPVLGDNPVPFDLVFGAMSKVKTPYISIELPQPDTLDELYANTKKSVEYLRKNF